MTMTLEDILDQFYRHGRLSAAAIDVLSQHLRGSDPYDAITVATDCGAFDLAELIAEGLDSKDDMVRWNAAATLFTRFRLPQFAQNALLMAQHEKSELLRCVALCGLGELLPRIKDESLRLDAAKQLYSTFVDHSESAEARAAAYDGMLAAVDVLPLDRPPATRGLDSADVDCRRVDQFRSKYQISD